MMNNETLYYPNYECKYYGKPFEKGYLVKNGTSYGQKQFLCGGCGRSISVRHGTAYYNLDTKEAIFEIAVRALAEGNSVRSAARIVEVDKDTICNWLDRAAQHSRLVMLYLWQNLHITECQLDELWSFVHTKQRNLAAGKIMKESYGDAWVWLAFTPQWRLVLSFVVGKRNQASADLLLKRVKHVTDEHIPFFTSDQLPEYKRALLSAYGKMVKPERKGNCGRYPKPRLGAPEELKYVQVVKKRVKGRVVSVTRKEVFGSKEEVDECLENSEASKSVNTSFVERENLTLRQSNRRLTRKTNGFAKELGWFERQLWLSLAYYHLVLPQGSLRQRLSKPEPTGEVVHQGSGNK